MGAGKSTLGRIVAQEFSWPYFDNDHEMTVRYGFSQEELASMSVQDLHQLESRYLADILSEDAPFITGAAASVVDYAENRKLLESVSTIYLKIPLSEVIARAGKSGVGRQALFNGGDAVLSERYERRDPLYREVSKTTLELGIEPLHDAKQLSALIKNL